MCGLPARSTIYACLAQLSFWKKNPGISGLKIVLHIWEMDWIEIRNSVIKHQRDFVQGHHSIKKNQLSALSIEKVSISGIMICATWRIICQVRWWSSAYTLFILLHSHVRSSQKTTTITQDMVAKQKIHSLYLIGSSQEAWLNIHKFSSGFTKNPCSFSYCCCCWTWTTTYGFCLILGHKWHITGNTVWIQGHTALRFASYSKSSQNKGIKSPLLFMAMRILRLEKSHFW